MGKGDRNVEGNEYNLPQLDEKVKALDRLGSIKEN